MTDSPERSSQSESEEPVTPPPHLIQDLSTAEIAVALTDVRDAVEILERSRRRQLRDGRSWAVLGGGLLLFGALVGGGAAFFLSASLLFLPAANNCRRYLRSRGRWRELRAQLGPLQERWEQSRKAT